MCIRDRDYIVDLGPEGGDGGGTVVACGTPEQIAECEKSYTGEYLKKYLPSEKSEQKSVPKRQRKTEV